MIILHAGLAADQFLLWGERPAEATLKPARWRGRQARVQSARPLPYDAGVAGLLAGLGEVAHGLTMDESDTAPMIVWLPTAQDQPLASSPLIAEPLPSEVKAALAPWKITTLPLSTAEAVELLCACVDKETLAPGVLIGKDLAFWATAMRLAGALVARQQFLPGVQDDEQTARARWEPVLAGAEAHRLAQLAKAMPPACRALTRDATTPPATPAASLLAAFLGEVVDHLVRSAIAPEDFPLAPTLKPRAKAGAFESLHDHWLHALRAEDGEMTGKAAELAQLAEQVREWRRPIAAASATPFRLCFRLEEPEAEAETQPRKKARRTISSANGDETWYVRYLLQAADDPSLLVPVAQAWAAKGPKAKLLQRGAFKPREYLLSALGQAASLSPRIEASLKTSAPGGCELDTAGAHEFLTEKAWLLEQAGFGVLLPAWWTLKGTKVRLTARAQVESPKLQSRGGLSLEEIVKFNWEVALGEHKLSLAELEMLAKLKAPLVKVRGQWVQLNAEEIQAALDFWQKKAAGQATVREVVRMALGAGSAPGGIAFAGVSASGWIGELLTQLEGRAGFAELPPPEQLHGTLRPYQVRGYSWLAFLRQWGLGACLADDMGLGKCCSAETLIAVNGTLVKAEDLWRRFAGEAVFDGEGYWAAPTEPLFTNSLDESTGRMTQTEIRRLYRQRVNERLRKVTLEDGSSITITRSHKLLTLTGWTNELRAGDYACVPAKLLWRGQPENADLVTLLAWQIAEGYELRDRATVCITQKDPRVLEQLRGCLHRLQERHGIKINHPAIQHPKNGRAAYLRLSSAEYQRFLEARGYEWGKLSREKSIPPFILRADVESVRLFLRHYFDAEAAVIPRMRSIEISTASPLLIQQLALLLRRFGIWLRLSAKQKCATNGQRILRTYYLGTLGGNAARRFAAEIGFATPEKQRRLEQVCAARNNTNVEGVPASAIVAQAVAATHLPVRHFGRHNTVYLDGSQPFSRARLNRVVAACDLILSGEAERRYRQLPLSRWTRPTLAAYAHLDSQRLSATRQTLQHLLDQEVFYCRIKAVEEIEYYGWVYDFEVAGHHNFVANQILCHNTIQALALIERDWEANGHRPTLLVCPMSVVGNWQKEAARFTPALPVLVHHGLTRAKGVAFKKAADKQAIVLSSYALLHRDFELLKGVDWAGVILDEAQNIKNAQTKQARAARALSADYRIALTGTPVENNVGDLWSLMEFLNPGFLGTQAEFKRTFFVPIQAQRDPDAAQRLKRLTGPFILRRLKTDKTIIADLPEKLEMKVFCTLTKEQASLYAAVVKEASEELEASEGIQRKGLVLATLSKLKQICNHPAQFLGDNSAIPGRSGKLARLTEMLEEALAEGDRALVFSQFAEMGALIQRHLQETFGQEVLFLHGAVPKKRRDRMIERFQQEMDCPRVFVLSLKAGGTGLNLTAANHVFHFDRWWNPAVENQATDRAFRIGQRRNVQVHKFLCAGTLEEKIDEMIEHKQELAAQIVGAGEGWLTELSTAQLRELFALRQEAVGE